MQIKKAGGKIFGASLTAAEQKAMNMEIQRQLGAGCHHSLGTAHAARPWSKASEEVL